MSGARGAALGALGAVRAVTVRFLRDEGFMLASALSFSFILCVAPLVLITFAMAGYLLESDEIAEWMFDTLSVLLPAYAREVAELLGVLARERAVIGVVGVASLVVFARPFVTLMRTVVNRAFRVSRRRTLLHGLVFDMAAVLVIAALAFAFLLSMVALVAFENLATGMAAAPGPLPIRVTRLAARPLVYALGLLLLFLAYRTLPNTRVPRRAAAIGALMIAPLWELARWGFTVYVKFSGGYGRLYGSFGVALATLVWIYYSAAIFTFGAEAAALMTEREAAGKAPREGPDAEPPC